MAFGKTDCNRIGFPMLLALHVVLAVTAVVVLTGVVAYLINRFNES